MDSLNSFAGTYSEHLVNLSYINRVPISGTFELIPACNMKCKMCYIQQEPSKELFGKLQPVEFWEDIFSQAIEEGMIFPLITGGEPLLYPDFFKLYERVINKGIHLCLNTNATLLDREKVALLAKRPPRRLNISLYGASNETYGALCGNEKGFDKVINAFDLLKEYDIPFRVHSVLVQDNYHDYQGIIDICNKYQVPLGMAYYMFPAYRKEKENATTEGRFSPAKMAEIAIRYAHDNRGGDSQEYKDFISNVTSIIENPQKHVLFNHNGVACRGGKCTFWIDWRGNISSCGMHNQLGIDLKKTTFKEAWERIISSTDDIRIAEKCKTCKYRCICPVCPAAGFCETGSLSGVPEYLCDFCEIYGELLLNERKRLFG